KRLACEPEFRRCSSPAIAPGSGAEMRNVTHAWHVGLRIVGSSTAGASSPLAPASTAVLHETPPMPLTITDFAALAAACAPQVPLETIRPIVSVESGFNPLAINVNGKPKLVVRARNREEAVGLARRLIAQGRSVDLGLGQINSANLDWLGLTV